MTKKPHRRRPVERVIRALPSAGLAVALLLGVLPSCGGRSEDNDGSSGGSASGGAGSSSGAAASGAGTSPTGSGGATTGSGGATTGSGGSSGSGGLDVDWRERVCELPAETGNCTAAFPRYFHDSTTGVCKPFVYGGCGGNENNFDSFEACVEACGSAPLDECTENSECVLHSRACCGPCEPIVLADYVAINSQHDTLYETMKGCDGILCGACPEPVPGQTTGSFYVPTCDLGHCQVLDLRYNDVTACEDAADCSLRIGSNCCEGCSSTGFDLIAVSDEAALTKLVCAYEPAACPPCVPTDPEGYAPDCVEGRCVVKAVP